MSHTYAAIAATVILFTISTGADGEETIIGRWIDPLPYGMGVVTIERKGDGYVLLAEPTFTKPYTMSLRRVSKTRFNYKETPNGDYVVILKDGRLDTRDNEGEGQILRVAPGGTGQDAERMAAAVSAKDDVLCRSDLNCIVIPRLKDARDQCERSVEHSARWDYRWTDVENPFVGYRWNPKAPSKKGLVDFYGDRVQLQNGFGAWMNENYVCTYDTINGHVTGLVLRPGHLPQHNKVR